MTSGAASGGAETPATHSNVFISYSRRDMEFVNRLAADLERHSIAPKIDRTEIYSFEDWWKRIQVLIAEADTIVFVLSPDSVASDVCRREVDYALSLRKRFAPIVCRSVAAHMSQVPQDLADLNFIFFDAPDGYEPAMDRLVEALSTDIAWVRKHTQFGLEAQAWIEAGRPGGLLLRPPRLEEAEKWIAMRPPNAPLPTTDTQAFVMDSRRGASRRRNILTGSLAAGLVLAVGLASAAVVFGLEAKSQKQVADRKTVEARLQRDAADKARKDAEQRAGLLAANVATKYTAQGAYAAADLLLLNAAKAFAPKDTPDALLIAESNLLDRLEQTVDLDIPPQSRVLDTAKAVFIANDADKSVWAYGDRGLVKLLDGGSRTAGVWAATVDGDGSYLFLSLDGKVERLCAGCTQPTVIATLPSLAKYTLRTDPDWHATATFHESGWLIRESPTTGPGDSPTVIDMLDLKTGAQFEVAGTIQEVVPAKAPTGEDLFYDGNHLFRLAKTGDAYAFEAVAPDVDERLKGTIPFATCLAHFKPAAQSAVLDAVRGQTIFDCRSFGAYGLLSVVMHAASADSRSDTIFYPDGAGERSTKGKDLLDLLKNKTDSSDNMTSVAIDAKTGRIAAIQDKVLYLIDASEVQATKMPTAPSAVRFTPDGRIALVDGPSGHIRVLQTGATHVHTVVDAKTDPPQTVEFYHLGGCPLPRDVAKQQVDLPEGKVVALDYVQSDGGAKLSLSMGASTSRPLPGPVALDGDCAQISRDFKRALVRKGATLSLYPAVESPADLGAHIDVPIDARSLSSAFLDETNGSVVVSDFSTKVTRWSFDPAGKAWSSSVLYDGELLINYAEPDPSGQRLIIRQSAGMGVQTAFVYSLAARERWFDLGSNYRWLDARYTQGGDVAVSRDFHLTDLFHVLAPEAYVKLLDADLPARCRSASNDATKSPCWPLAGQ